MLRNDLPAAEAAYRKMIEVAPNVAAGYQGLARVLATRKDLDGALAALQQGIQVNPDDLVLPSYRAEWLARASRYNEAIKAYEALLAKRPGDEAANNNLAYLLVESKGDAASLQRALQLTSRFAESRNPSYLDSLAWVHYKLGDYAKAVPLLERAVTLQPGSPLYSAHLGMALVKSGATQRGQEVLKKVLSAKAELGNLDEVRKMAGVN
jgi:tetratricopeptide (TPR) repeat protein